MTTIRTAALLLLLPAALTAQRPPPVHVVATGGTISNTGGERLTGEALVRDLPGVDRHAALTVEQFSNVASGSITLEQWRALATRINQLYRERPELAGVVVTHGTDTMEETAYFLDLTVGDCRPVVITGAMRRATDIGADGPANLYNAVRVAAHPEARGLGAVVLMNDGVYPAREVTKTNTTRVDAFAAPGVGRLAVADPDTVAFFQPRAPRGCAAPAFDVSGVERFPRVDVVHSYLGADGALIRAAADAGARGIVVASVGRGGTTPGQRAAIEEVVGRGVFVVLSSRTGAGRVPVEGRDLGEWSPGRGAVLGADDLNPHKARILLMLALTRTQDAREIAALLDAR